MLDKYRESNELQSHGTWVHVPDDDMSFKVRRVGTPEANKELTNIKRALFGIDYSEIGLTEEQRLDASMYFLASWVITDWDNVREKETDEESIPYSKSNALTFIYKDKELWYSLNPYLLARAADYNNFLKTLVLEDTEQVKKP
jgi:hypothetical protein